LKSVLSASRRTDIPAFYMDWFMQGIRKGVFEVVNPFRRDIFRVPATVADVHTIVFWSKNFGPFIQGNYGQRLQDEGYHLFFNFTLNSESKLLEPELPSLSDRLNQLAGLCRHHDPRSIHWRFDPICFFRDGTSEIQDNRKDFVKIADKAARLGVKRCITSFLDMYPKIVKRTARRPGFSFVDVAMERKINVLGDMVRILEPMGISLHLCCEKGLLEKVRHDLPIEKSACIPNNLIMNIYGGRVSLGKDSGQRLQAGCGCMKSVDIGSYDRQPCHHNCVFCYANPACDTSRPKPL